ncbi:2-amino-4-hydroxy-6-hydroxymethyldihydropteridine diphosphokinase [uncultured Muribaculum sp.]|uniref:2-amino-4-hydroxy-6- hydroxymethyldihydropteridine diphosphokinase n=1 Tax=uncultured Muribaculum sp. TaxID=1918613 RepID=UPI00263142DE|nr:2-amino-4-hydroxy-6-hydroxymethyldihydropteridine diphosphokinase [uncultured Muribaculum sp.]
MFKVHLNIGSNQGCRSDNIGRAAALVEHSGCVVSACRSAIVETEPWGYISPNAYMNMGMLLHTAMSPHELVRVLQAIESGMGGGSHRNKDGTYADRLIDIDIVAVNDASTGTPFVCNDNLLTLPHPRMHMREFVLIPMQEMDPGWMHPVTGLTPAQMLKVLENKDSI